MKSYIYYFYSSLAGSMLGVLLDEAKKNLIKKDVKLYFVMCEGFFSSCLSNPRGNTGICSICKNQTSKIIYDALGDNVEILKLSDYYKGGHQISDIVFNSSNEVKKYKYKQIEIGYGVMSSYIHLTRNHEPKIDSNSKIYFQNQLLQSIQLIDAFTEIIDKIKPTQISTFNGRFNEIKPVFELALQKKIHLNLYEFERLDINHKKFAKVVFKNCMPHSVSGNRWKFDSFWKDKNLSTGENIKLAKEFFNNKKNGIAAGDKVYVKGDMSGILPLNWDTNKENIVIFNSSEDEYVSIGKEWENLALFKNQLEGLKYIFEQNKSNSNIHFYLKIHPNLYKVKYKYHLDLYKLHYNNVTIIGESDKLNSYDLMHAANKIIVFGSTMGLEAAYWKKPVILLGCSWYYYEGLCYIPKTKKELNQLIPKKLLPIGDELKILKMGLFHYHRDSTIIDKNSIFSYINFNPKIYKIFNFEIIGYNYQKMLGSVFFKTFVVFFMKIISRLFFKNRFILPLEDE